jgi:glycosyltransferase involved in cell wall biosynthesis
MLVTYVAPNRAHHYAYAQALARSGCLQRFVSGFSRFSPRAPIPELGDKLLRADHLQNVYLAALKLRAPSFVSEELAYLSKIWLDRCAEQDASHSDAVLFYSGAGLHTQRALGATPVRGIVEAVNSHVLVQREILSEEYQRLRLPMKGFHPREVARRVKEYELADGIICPSGFVHRSFIEQGIPAHRIQTVPFGIQVPDRIEPEERPGEVFRVLYVGQINIRKGLRYLFEAFEKLKHPRKELWIVGPRSEPTGIDDIAPPAQTRFLGVLKGKDLSRAYRSCHVFALPTLEEGLALVIGEALSHGLPVIATVNSGGEDLFADGKTGFLVPVRSPGIMAEKLQALADQPALRAEMSASAVARDNGLRSWENAGEALVKALENLIKMPKKG